MQTHPHKNKKKLHITPGKEEDGSGGKDRKRKGKKPKPQHQQRIQRYMGFLVVVLSCYRAGGSGQVRSEVGVGRRSSRRYVKDKDKEVDGDP